MVKLVVALKQQVFEAFVPALLSARVTEEGCIEKSVPAHGQTSDVMDSCCLPLAHLVSFVVRFGKLSCVLTS